MAPLVCENLETHTQATILAKRLGVDFRIALCAKSFQQYCLLFLVSRRSISRVQPGDDRLITMQIVARQQGLNLCKETS
jgi:hypothetical protein